jgi:hypothetical protein
MLTCFGMIWNCDNVLRWNKKSGKIYTLSKICIYSKLIVKKKRHNGATINKINKKFQNISFKNSSSWKHVFFDNKTPKRIVVLNAK